MKNIIQPKSPRISRFWYMFALALVICFLLGIFFPSKKLNDPTDLEESSKIAAPVFSEESGYFFVPSFLLTLSTSEKDAQIVYTLDGSMPDNNSAVYSEPLQISDRINDENVISEIPTSPRWLPPLKTVRKAVVVRAAIIKGENRISETVTRTYFVSKENPVTHTLPVVSLVTDNRNLFDHKTGIYVMGKRYEDKDNYISKNIPLDLPWWSYPANYSRHGKKTYRPVYMEFFESDRKAGFAIPAMMRISGNATRGYSQKSLSIYFKKSNKKEQLDYRLFLNDTATSFKNIVLRNAGNDWDKAFIRDAFIENMLKKAGYDAPAYRTVVVYLNGEYWGIHQMSERMDAGYLSLRYGLDIDNIKVPEYIKATAFGNEFDDPEYMRLLKLLREKDVSLPENYKLVRQKMDMENFMDYVIAEVFFANSDWPHNNFLFWRYVKPLADSSDLPQKDGRFRWMMTDFDYGYGAGADVNFNMLPKAKQDYIFSRLITNAEFKKQFLARFQQHLNTTFQPQKAIAGIDSLQALLEPEIQDQIDRWRVLGSIAKWKGNLDVMRDFADRRPAVQAEQLNTFFKLEGAAQIRVKKQ